MFTGIVASIGRIEHITPLGDKQEMGVRLRIHAGTLPLNDIKIGDSIAIEGACMTVVHLAKPYFEVEVSQASLQVTRGLSQLGEVHLEKALRLSDTIDGHLVAGHVDGLGQVSHFTPVGESWLLRITAPNTLAKYLATKGSITVNGVSLTINALEDHAESCIFSINLIPHTLTHTTLKHLQVGAQVNLEIDLIARYVERMLHLSQSSRSLHNHHSEQPKNKALKSEESSIGIGNE